MGTAFNLPDAVLLSRLHDIGLAQGWSSRPVSVIERTATARAATTAITEVVTFRLDDDSVRRVFAKTGKLTTTDDPFRGEVPGGLGYEYTATRAAYAVAPGDVPRPQGLSTVAGPGATLVFDDVSSYAATRSSPGKLAAASLWIGNFHARARTAPAKGVHRHDEAFYLRWIDPFLAAQSRWCHELELHSPPAGRVREQLVADAGELAHDPFRTVIHGDFYSNNVLENDNQLVVVDWELTAVGSGTLDLATLLLGWDDDLCETLLHTYASSSAASWPPPAPGLIAAAQRHVIARIVASRAPDGKKSTRRLRTRLETFLASLGR